MAAGAQADGAACLAGRAHLQPAQRAVRRPAPATDRGRGALLSVTPIVAAVRAADDLDRVFNALAREGNGGLMVLSDLGMTNHREALIALAAHHRVPAVYPFRYFAASGGLMSYGTDVAEVFRRAAAYVNHILKGTSPGDLPVQAPTKYDLVVNLKTAKAL